MFCYPLEVFGEQSSLDEECPGAELADEEPT
jgi:hypothetical protein